MKGLGRNEQAQLCCNLAKQMEKLGEYESAAEAMAEFWPDRNKTPIIQDLDIETSGRVLLRVGNLIGFLCGPNLAENNQERSKDLITQSMEFFERAGASEHASEARGDLALCYWREGAFDEARIHLTEALHQLGDSESDLKAVLLVRMGIIEERTRRLQNALGYYAQAEPLVANSQDHVLKGAFHAEVALVFRRLAAPENGEDYMDRALIEYAAARFHYEQAGNERHQARIESNLGYLYHTIRRNKDALRHLDSARGLFSKLGDTALVANVDDSRARVFIAEGMYAEAERIVLDAVAEFEKSDAMASLGEALTTHGVCLARMGKYSMAQTVLGRAMEVSLNAGDLEGSGRAAITMLEELASSVPHRDQAELFRRAAELLGLSNEPTVLKRLINCGSRTLGDETVPTKRRLRVFLCHAREDKPAVRLLYAQLINHNIEPWFDEENLLPGQDWEMEIASAVAASDVVAVCLSKTSTTKAGFVQKEIKYALDVADRQPDRTIYLIPLKLEECELPERLRSRQSVDHFEETGFTRLLISLQRRAADLDVALPRSTHPTPDLSGARL